METKRAPAQASNAPVDTDDLLNRCLGRLDIVERILNRFQGALDSELAQLEEALLETDTGKVAQIAHRIKGASLAVSAYGLGDCASLIEKSASTSQLDGVQEQVDRMKELRTLIRETRVPTNHPERDN